MARCSDLPTELRVQVLRHLFVNTSISYSLPPHCDRWVYRPQLQVLNLMLTAKSFAHSLDIINAMMLETTLRIRSDRDVYTIGQNLDYGTKPLCQLRSLELAAPFEIKLGVRLRKFKSLLPNLTQIRVEVIEASFPSLWIPPEIIIPGTGFIRDRRDHFNVGRQIVNGPYAINLDRFSSSIPDPRYIPDWADEENLPTERPYGPIYSPDSTFAISRALVLLPDSGYNVDPARWLVALLLDAIVEDFGVDIILSWESEVRVAKLTPGDDYLFIVRPTFFSTKDMCIRFLREENERVIPQTFPISMRNFADDQN